MPTGIVSGAERVPTKSPMRADGRRAVVLLSGGLDSATVLALAQSRGYRCHALSFRYGQRHGRELVAARRLARHARVPHTVVAFDLRLFGGSALTDHIAVPKGRSPRRMARSIPVTYVPARNTIFLAFALGRAETVGAADIFLGVNAVDYSGYPDCRPEYVRAFARMANLATRAAVEGSAKIRIHAPLVRKTKADIVRLGYRLGVDFGMTWSCYDPEPGGIACGRCDSCRLRLAGFAAADLVDPLPYRRPRSR